ncbi:MAG: hypothetical protein WCP39_01075 [Chlamydiota bacterium]
MSSSIQSERSDPIYFGCLSRAKDIYKKEPLNYKAQLDNLFALPPFWLKEHCLHFWLSEIYSYVRPDGIEFSRYVELQDPNDPRIPPNYWPALGFYAVYSAILFDEKLINPPSLGNDYWAAASVLALSMVGSSESVINDLNSPGGRLQLKFLGRTKNGNLEACDVKIEAKHVYDIITGELPPFTHKVRDIYNKICRQEKQELRASYEQEDYELRRF